MLRGFVDIQEFFVKYIFITFVFFGFFLIVSTLVFVVLLERVAIGESQLRNGPFRISILGLFQGIVDGFKALGKQWVVPKRATKILFLIGGFLSLFTSLIMWAMLVGCSVQKFGFSDLEFTSLYILGITGFGIYAIFLPVLQVKLNILG
jgi:NADH-quinone oxidoreductase subunit H